MKKIKSETSILLKLIWGLLSIPYLFLLAVFGRRRFGEVFVPFKDFLRNLFNTKFTSTMFFLLLICFVISIFLSEQMLDLFVIYPEDIFSARFYTLITHGFLHANIIHLFGNLLALLIFGRVVESELGAKKTFLVYFVALIFAGIFSSVINLFYGVSLGSVGASGAIMGLVSAAMLLRPFYFSYIFIIPLPIMVLAWLYIYTDISGVILGISDNVGRFAHIGGFLSVFFIYFLLDSSSKKKLTNGLIVNAVTIFLLLLILLFS